MIRLENMTPPTNLNPQPVLVINRWVINNDFVFMAVTDEVRQKITIPARSITFKSIRPRRMRAEAVRGALTGYRKAGKLRISAAQVDQAFLDVLRADGCDPLFVGYEKAKLTAAGFASKLWLYWRIPAATNVAAKE
jgi:hypothetical protein